MMDQRLYPASSIGYRALLHLPGPESHKLSSDIHHTLTHDSTLHSSTLAPGKLGFIAHNRSGSNIKYGGGKVFLFLTYSQLKEMLAFLLFSKSVLCWVLCCVWYPLSGPQLTVIHSNLHSWLINPGSNCLTRAAPHRWSVNTAPSWAACCLRSRPIDPNVVCQLVLQVLKAKSSVINLN